MVKPKKPEIGVWKTVESKGHHKHQKEKPKPFLGDLPAKSNKQSNDAGRSRHPKHSRSTPRQQFHDRNRQRNNFSNSMPFPPHRSPIPMPCGSYYSMSCFYPSWYYNSCMPSLPRYLFPDYITYREPAIGKPSPTINDRFDEKDRSIQKKKYKVIKQVYRVKKNERLNKNSDLTLDKEKPIVEEQSDSSISKIVPNDDRDSNSIVEQCSSLAGGQDKSNHIGYDRTVLTGLSDRSDWSEPGKSGGAKNRTKPTFEELLDKYKKMSEQKQSNQLEGKRRSSSPPR